VTTATYKSPLQEFWHVFPQLATPALFNVAELLPPPGMRMIITNVEGGGATTNRFRLLVAGATQITANLTAGALLLSNPPGFLAGSRVGTRADVGAFGYIYAPAVRQPLLLRAVVDSVADQRFVAIYQVANEATEFSIKGYMVASEFDTSARLTL